MIFFLNVKAILVRLTTSLALICFILFAPLPSYGLYEENTQVDPAVLDDALKAGERFEGFFEAINDVLLERDYVIRIAELALIAEEHMLIMGPPGGAKSKLADEILGRIVDSDNKKSYYRLQMTPETTLAETHGPIDYPTLTSTGKYDRRYEEGMLHSRHGFIDEIFDGRANALRNVLTLLNERAHAQGPHIRRGDIETVFAASNKYISSVYKKADDDGPRALLERFAFSAFIPAIFEHVDSYETLALDPKRERIDIPRLTFDDLKSIRVLRQEVRLPSYISRFLTLLNDQFGSETRTNEIATVKTYEKDVENGKKPKPPYRSTKYNSSRTFGKASQILRSIVVRDWIKKRGKRRLSANSEDIEKLEMFYTLNGPNDRFITSLLSNPSDPHEEVFLQGIEYERRIFRKHYQQILKDQSEVAYKYGLADLEIQSTEPMLPDEEKQFTDRIVKLYYEVRAQKINNKKLTELSAEDIGLGQVEEFLAELLREKFGENYVAEIKSLAAGREAAAAAENAAVLLSVEKKRKQLQEIRDGLNGQLHFYNQNSKYFEQIEFPSQQHTFSSVSPSGNTSAYYLKKGNRVSIFRKSEKSAISFELGSQQFRVEDLALLDDHSFVVADNSGLTIYNTNSARPVDNVVVPELKKSRYLLGADKKMIHTLGNRLDTLTHVDLKKMYADSISLNPQVESKVAGLGSLSIVEVAKEIFGKTEGLYFSTDHSKSYFTTRHMRRLFEIDESKSTVTLVHTIELHGSSFNFNFLRDVQIPFRIFGAAGSNSSMQILEINLEDFNRSKVHTIPFPFSVDQFRGVTIIENGTVAVLGSQSGLFFFDLIKGVFLDTDGTLTKQLHQGPINLGAGMFGYVDSTVGSKNPDGKFVVIKRKNIQ